MTLTLHRRDSIAIATIDLLYEIAEMHRGACTPSSILALSNLCEALALYDKLIFVVPDKSNHGGPQDDTFAGAATLGYLKLHASPILEPLLRGESALLRLGGVRELGELETSSGGELDSGKLARDLMTIRGLIQVAASGEIKHLAGVFRSLHASGIDPVDLVDTINSGSGGVSKPDAERVLGGRENVTVLVDFAAYHLTCARIALAFDAHLYTSLVGAPISALVRTISVRRDPSQKVVQTLRERYEPDSLPEERMQCVDVPPFLRIVLERCGNHIGNVASAILEVRDEIAGARVSLAQKREALVLARTNHERREIWLDIVAGLNGLLAREQRRRRSWLLTIWNILKNPLQIRVSSGDLLIKDYEAEYRPLGRVIGLSDLDSLIGSAPVPEFAREQIANTFGAIDLNEWSEAGRAIRQLQNVLSTKNPTSG